jgi:hypothetical protein
MTRACVFCHKPTARLARIPLDLERGDIRIRIEGIPAHHCDACGSDGINGPLAEEISEGANQIMKAIEAALAVPAEA